MKIHAESLRKNNRVYTIVEGMVLQGNRIPFFFKKVKGKRKASKLECRRIAQNISALISIA
jgi:hypothetical protein